MKATFVYPNSRRETLQEITRGDAPDSQLHGALYLGEHGIDVAFHDPLLTRRALPGPLTRVAWNARELTVPLEVGRTDVVFTPLAALLPLASRIRALPVVAINFGLNLIWRRSSPARRAVLRASLRSAARVVCLGESQREELVDAARLEPGRILTMLIPVDDGFYAPQDLERGHTILAVGKDLARDYGTLAAAVGGSDVEATIVAHPRNLAGLHLPANVRTHEGVSFRGLRDLYAGAGVVVLPQHGDDFPFGSEGGGLTALLEAMAMGRPIVATDRAILHDYVEDGVEALLVPPGDSGALRTAIERVLGDDALAESLGRAARVRVERSHTSRRFAGELSDVLNEVV